MSTSLWALEGPVQNIWHDFRIELIDNDSVIWLGQVAIIIDAKGRGFQADLAFETPWYHCRACSEAGVSSLRTRLSANSKFCPECGARLDWEHLARDPAGEERVAADISKAIAERSAEGASTASDNEEDDHAA